MRRALPIRTVVAVSGLAFSLVLLAGCGSKRQPMTDPVIGEYGSMTGQQSTFGTSTDNGIELAVDQANQNGGVLGHKVTVKLYDDEGKPDTALTVVKRLIAEDHVPAVLGEVASTRSIAAAPECNSTKTPMITPSSTNPKVTIDKPYVFRVCYIDPFQGQMAAKFATQYLKLKRAAIFTDQKNDYSIGLSGVFNDAFVKDGGQIVATGSYQDGDVDFKAQLTNIKAANPQVIYVPGYYNDLGPIARQARQIGLTVPLLGGDGWDSSKLVEGAGGPGGALEGCYFTDHYSHDDPEPHTKAFVDAYKAKYNSVPDALAALGYDAAGVLMDAMKRAGPPADGDFSSEAYRVKLRDAIASTQDFPGATGKITIGPDRNAVKPLVVLQVKGSQFVKVTNENQ